MPSTGTRWTSTLRTAFSHDNGRLHTNFMHSEQGGAVLAPSTQQCSSRPPTQCAPRSVTRRGTGCARCVCPAMAPHACTTRVAVRRRRTGCARFGRLRPRLGAKWANLPQPTVSHNLTTLSALYVFNSYNTVITHCYTSHYTLLVVCILVMYPSHTRI